jgi:hypothetical protein
LAFAPRWESAFLELAEVSYRQTEGTKNTKGRALPEATVYHLDREGADKLAEQILAETAGSPMGWSPATVFDAETEVHALQGGALFEYGFELVGYAVSTDAPVRPGDALELVTVWRPRGEMAAAASELKVFVHLMDDQSRVWGGEDRLDIHPPTWERDDLLVQLHRVPVARDAPPGLYQLEVGVYAPITMQRLALYGGRAPAQPVGDRLLLSPIVVPE